MPPPIGRVHDSLESLGGESSGDLPRTIAGGGRDSVRKSGRRRSVLLLGGFVTAAIVVTAITAGAARIASPPCRHRRHLCS